MKLGILDTFNALEVVQLKHVLCEHQILNVTMQSAITEGVDALIMDVDEYKEQQNRLHSMNIGIPIILMFTQAEISLNEMHEILKNSFVHVVCVELFSGHVCALYEALEEICVSSIGTVNLIRSYAQTVDAINVLIQDMAMIINTLGHVQSIFAQRTLYLKQESAYLSMVMETGALVSLNAHTGTGTDNSLRYHYACQNGVISYDSNVKALVMHGEHLQVQVEASSKEKEIKAVLNHALNMDELHSKVLDEAIDVLSMAHMSTNLKRAISREEFR